MTQDQIIYALSQFRSTGTLDDCAGHLAAMLSLGWLPLGMDQEL